MRIKKILKSLLITFMICFVIVVIMSNSKNAWKIFGYTLCENIDDIQIYSVFKDSYNQVILIQGSSETANGFYSGYSFNIQNGNLYLGLKYNKYFGYENKTKDFKIEIPCQVYDIKNIYLVDGTNERKI